MKALACSLAFPIFASTAAAAIIPADALTDFRVDAWADLGDGPYATHVVAWHSTGLFLNQGDLFALVASGIAAPSPAGMAEGGFGPDGRGDAASSGPNALAPNLAASIYALVGKIGTDLGDEFLVGSSFAATANRTGILYLGFNDTSYRDNLGFFTVSTASIPEPSTSLLVALGLAWLARHRARP
jgi:hypothetical protein